MAPHINKITCQHWRVKTDIHFLLQQFDDVLVIIVHEMD